MTVIGIKQDGCGNHLNNSERRAAIIKQQIRVGMTAATLKQPGQAGQGHRAEWSDALRLSGQERQQRNVSFDEAGCVKGKQALTGANNRNRRYQRRKATYRMAAVIAADKKGLHRCRPFLFGTQEDSEPPTARFVAEYSIQLSYECMWFLNQITAG